MTFILISFLMVMVLSIAAILKLEDEKRSASLKRLAAQNMRNIQK